MALGKRRKGIILKITKVKSIYPGQHPDSPSLSHCFFLVTLRSKRMDISIAPQQTRTTRAYVINPLLLFLMSVINSGFCFLLTLQATATFNCFVQVLAYLDN